ncbi:MAG: DUF4382 domain-containing protein [candidate division WOR-3 bacterium]
MKKVVLSLIGILLVIGCGENEGWVRIWLIDSPPPQDVEAIYLRIFGVGVRNLGGDAITVDANINEYDIVMGTLGGMGIVIAVDKIKPGNYTSILIALTEIHLVRRNGELDTLILSEGSPLKYEIPQDFTIYKDKITQIFIDFDASKSINWETQPYTLTPIFRAFEGSTLGAIRGKVTDSTGAPIKFAVCKAVNSTDTFTTLSTPDSGKYYLIAKKGTYNITSYLEGYTSDTSYSVEIGDSTLKGYNFVLRKEY